MTYSLPRIIDLFSGAGGLSAGFELAGFETILGIDNFEVALKTFANNHEKARTLSIDLSKPIPDDIKKWLRTEEIYGIIGGPPCQGFSDAKGTRSINDERNDLVFSFMKWIEELNPIFFVMENVTGIATIQRGEFFKNVKERFRKMNYTIAEKILHAAEFGVPQKRERMFLIGVSKEYDVSPHMLHPRPMYYIPPDMKGLTGKRIDFNGNHSLDKWLIQDQAGTLLLEKSHEEIQLKKFTSIAEAFEGLPERTPPSGKVDLPNNYSSEYMRFIRKEGQVKTTTLHIAKPVRKNELSIVSKIPEGKIYRSNRFGSRYIGVWDVYKDQFTPEELLVLQFIGKAQTKKALILEEKEEGHVDIDIIINETGIQKTVLDNLESQGWLRRANLNGRTGYKLSTKAGLRPRFMRLSRKSIAHTILTVDFDGREKIHPTQNRGISLREGARLQSFPDEFHFEGTFSEVAKQIGNAVPPLLAYHIARNLIKAIRIKTKPLLEFP